MAARLVDLRLAPLDVPSTDGRVLRAEGPWWVRAGGAPIVDTAGTLVGLLEGVSVAGGWLLGCGQVDEGVDLAGVAPQFDLSDVVTVETEGWRVFRCGQVARVVLDNRPVFAGTEIRAVV